MYREDSNRLYESYLDARRNPHAYLLLDLAQDTDNCLRFRTHNFPSEVTVVYAPLGYEKDTVELSPFTSAQAGVATTAKTILENSNKDLVLGIAELALTVLNGNCKISKNDVDRLRKHKSVLRRLVDSGIALRRKRKLIVPREGFLHPLLTAALSALPSLIQL